MRITLPDGRVFVSGEGEADEVLPRCLGCAVTLASAVPQRPQLEEYWPDTEELNRQDTVTHEAIPVGTFFDLAPVHLLSTATLSTLQQALSASRSKSARGF